MVEGFWKEIGRHLFDWSAWIFTVGGTIVALWLAKEHWWLSLLIVLTLAWVPLTFSYRTYRKWEAAEARHQADVERLRAEHQAAMDRLQQAEQKLNEVPSALLGELQRVIERHSFAELARELIVYADFVGRMTGFARAFPKPMNLRAFTKQAGGLYALAKVGAKLRNTFVLEIHFC